MPTHRPWISNLIWSFYGIVAGAICWTTIGPQKHEELRFAMTAAFGLFVLWHLKQFNARTFGKSAEQKALKALRKITGDMLQSNIPFPGKGDIDALLTLPDEKINIEIKSFKDIKRVSGKDTAQAMAASNYLKSSPVIWLPLSPTKQIKNKDDVRIFAGNAKEFAKFLGC